jgi:hypothetical protein
VQRRCAAEAGTDMCFCGTPNCLQSQGYRRLLWFVYEIFCRNAEGMVNQASKRQFKRLILNRLARHGDIQQDFCGQFTRRLLSAQTLLHQRVTFQHGAALRSVGG